MERKRNALLTEFKTIEIKTGNCKKVKATRVYNNFYQKTQSLCIELDIYLC